MISSLWGILTGLIEIIREFFTNLIEQIKEANPFKKGWHTPLLADGVTEEYIFEFMADVSRIHRKYA